MKNIGLNFTLFSLISSTLILELFVRLLVRFLEFLERFEFLLFYEAVVKLTSLPRAYALTYVCAGVVVCVFRFTELVSGLSKSP